MSRLSDKHSATARRTMKQKYRSVFETPEGKDVLQDIMKNCFVLKSAHVVGDSHTSAMQEGCRVVALNILSRLGYDYTEFIEQAMEQQKDHYDSLRNMARAAR